MLGVGATTAAAMITAEAEARTAARTAAATTATATATGTADGTGRTAWAPVATQPITFAGPRGDT